MTTRGRMTKVSRLSELHKIDECLFEFILVLTWISIYWFSRPGPAASVRIYYEFRKSREKNWEPGAVNIPTGYSFFPKELLVMPR